MHSLAIEPSGWDVLRHPHKDARVVALWLRLFGPQLAWLIPARRRLILGLAGLAFAAWYPLDTLRDEELGGRTWAASDAVPVAVILSVFAYGCYAAARRFAALPAVVRARPLLWLHGGFWLLLLLLWLAGPAHPALELVLAGCALAMPFLLWRLSYLVQGARHGKMAGSGFLDHALYLWPAWGGTDTPYGKGREYLLANEAQDAEALARSQLAGLKLIWLGLVWRAAHRLLNAFLFGAGGDARAVIGDFTLDLPSLSVILRSGPEAYAPWQAWVALYGNLVLQVLKLAAYGHLVVGYVRLCGFHVFRNTYKPLLAESVIEFWNRYYYYFKELLLHFFFFPTFARRFKRSPKLRLFAAVFASAFFGNLYYHVLQEESLVRADWAALSDVVVPRTYYCLFLALGIYVSMRREQRRPALPGGRPPARRAVAILGVWTFYALLSVLHQAAPSMRVRLEFLIGLVGAA
jgi:hypothetical protein